MYLAGPLWRQDELWERVQTSTWPMSLSETAVPFLVPEQNRGSKLGDRKDVKCTGTSSFWAWSCALRSHCLSEERRVVCPTAEDAVSTIQGQLRHKVSHLK